MSDNIIKSGFGESLFGLSPFSSSLTITEESVEEVHFIASFRQYAEFGGVIEYAEATFNLFVLNESHLLLRFISLPVSFVLNITGEVLFWRIKIMAQCFVEETFYSAVFLNLINHNEIFFESAISQQTYLSLFVVNKVEDYINQMGGGFAQNALLGARYLEEEEISFAVWVDQSAIVGSYDIEYINVDVVIPPGQTLILDSSNLTCYLLEDQSNVHNIIHLHRGAWLFLSQDTYDTTVVTNGGEPETMIMYQERWL